MYKTELHFHSTEMSSCAKLPLHTIMDAYKRNEYSTLVLTDHFYPMLYDRFPNFSHEAIVDCFLTNWQDAVEYGKRLDLIVLFGIELRFFHDNNDYLLYGVSPDYLKEKKDILRLDIKTLHEIADREGFLVFQAHPFRNNMKIVSPAYLHGIEGYNGNINHDSRNDIAHQWSKKYHLPMMSGSDAHQQDDVGRGGIITTNPINTTRDLLDTLKSQLYTLIET